MMNLGYLENFKGDNIVLLSGAAEDIKLLSSKLAEFVKSGESEWPIHPIASISVTHSLKLWASRGGTGVGFRWLCSAEEFPTIQEKLEPLANGGAGHQYFPLSRSSAELMVSVGEYDADWWKHHG